MQRLPPGSSNTTTFETETLGQQLQSDSEREKFESFLHFGSEYMHHENADIPSSMEQQLSDVDCIETLLRQLNFGSLNTRHEAVPEAYEKTFSWIFEQPKVSENNPDDLPWADFPEWLEHDSESVYWITGKPGSGKSTIMKYVCGDERLMAHLRNWSGSKPFYTAKYFSWYAGDALQKSQEGLLRSLLYQIIRQTPQVALRWLPNRWAMLKLFGASAARNFPPWSYKELRDSMATMKNLTNDFNIAILIDGLDEFDGEHAQLINLIKDLHRQPGIKICVSSRPWNAFRDAFSGCPQLRMENLTQKDMEAFVLGKFETSVAISELRGSQPTIADELVADIVRKSEGVFLWVSLVTNSILDGIVNGDTLTGSYRLLDELPSDLGDLYSNLWSRVQPEHKEERARLLCVLQHYSSSILKDYWPSQYGFPSFLRGLSQALLWFSAMEATSSFSATTFARRLHSRTKGLIEIKPSGFVDYLHRTAHDWIMARWDEVQLEIPAKFDGHMALVTGFASTVHLADYSNSCCGDSSAWIILAFHHASMVSEQHRDRSFAELDRLADEICNAAFKQTSAGSDPSREDCWLSSSYHGFKIFGFVSLAAALSGEAYSYARAKMIAEPACYTIDGNADDLIRSIVLGVESRDAQSCFSKQVVRRINTERFETGRLDLAKLWFRYALERTKDRAALLSQLVSLHDDLSWRFRRKFEGEQGSRSYYKEMLRIFRSHGVGLSFDSRLARGKYVARNWFRSKKGRVFPPSWV